jgi:serine/threonine protein kinase
MYEIARKMDILRLKRMLGENCPNLFPDLGDPLDTKINGVPIEKLGEGCFGVVYKVPGPSGEPLAVKITKDPNVNEVIYGNLQRQFKSPSLEEVYYAASTPLGSLLVSRFYGGGSLENPKSKADVVENVIPLLRALEELHARGLIHGDLRRDNVVIGADGLAALIDFGLSCHCDPDDGHLLRGESVPLGVVNYFAKGLAASGIPPDFRRLDTWFLGTTLYGALTGEDLRSAMIRTGLFEANETIIITSDMAVSVKDPELFRNTISKKLDDSGMTPLLKHVMMQLLEPERSRALGCTEILRQVESLRGTQGEEYGQMTRRVPPASGEERQARIQAKAALQSHFPPPKHLDGSAILGNILNFWEETEKASKNLAETGNEEGDMLEMEKWNIKKKHTRGEQENLLREEEESREKNRKAQEQRMEGASRDLSQVIAPEPPGKGK